jgi:hypothetical protein
MSTKQKDDVTLQLKEERRENGFLARNHLYTGTKT